MYSFSLFLHIVMVMVLLGVSIATDASLSMARRSPEDAASLMRLVHKRLLGAELVSGLLAFGLGLTLLFVNPVGMKIFTTGGWIHMKVTVALIGIFGLLASRIGLSTSPAGKWVQPVRGIAQLCIVLAVFAAKVMRGG